MRSHQIGPKLQSVWSKNVEFVRVEAHRAGERILLQCVAQWIDNQIISEDQSAEKKREEKKAEITFGGSPTLNGPLRCGLVAQKQQPISRTKVPIGRPKQKLPPSFSRWQRRRGQRRERSANKSADWQFGRRRLARTHFRSLFLLLFFARSYKRLSSLITRTPSQVIASHTQRASERASEHPNRGPIDLRFCTIGAAYTCDRTEPSRTYTTTRTSERPNQSRPKLISSVRN